MTDRHGVPESVRRLLVYGGTFDPPHRAHMELAETARCATEADWLLFIPAARSPHRDVGPEAPMADRARMLASALPSAHCSVTTIEEDLASGAGAAVRTVDTLRRLRDDLAAPVEMRLLIGSDQAVAFHRWAEAPQVIELAEPVVLLRAPWSTREELADALKQNWNEREVAAWLGRVVDAPLVDVSATAVRDALRRGGTDEPVVVEALSASVRDIIDESGLYNAS